MSAFEKDAAIEVVAGMSKGARGRVAGPSRHRYDDEIVYFVALETGYVRPIRASYLRPLAVPTATASDDDVMSPLRRVTSGGA